MDKAVYRNNLRLKKQFREWLLKYGEGHEKNEDDFREVVRTVGHAWGVARTVSAENFNQFASNLFYNYEKIKQGKYDWKGTWESKICFLIAPEKYRLICDTQIRDSLVIINEITHVFTPLSRTEIRSIGSNSLWVKIVNQLYEQIGNPKEYDKIDALLWMSETFTTQEELEKRIFSAEN